MIIVQSSILFRMMQSTIPSFYLVGGHITLVLQNNLPQNVYTLTFVIVFVLFLYFQKAPPPPSHVMAPIFDSQNCITS